MKRLYFLLVIFCFILLGSNAFALVYDYTADNGSWNGYVTGLSSEYYATDLKQNSMNRNFEQSFSASSSTCQNKWCLIGSPNYTWATTTSKASEGSSSIYLVTGNSAPADNTAYLISDGTENVGDVNILFDLWNEQATSGIIYAGYMNDNNEFFPVLTITNATLSASWKTLNYYVPKGKYKIAFKITSGTASTVYPYLDNIRIVENNSGTFRTTDPQYCGSIGSCSNIKEFLPAKQYGNLYYIVDYVAGASCSYSTSSGKSGSMTEGTTGMYYFQLDENVSSGFYKDVNISASCLRVPYTVKSFFAQTRLYRYGQVTNGNFETSITGVSGACSNGWCYTIGGAGTVATVTPYQKFYSGLKALKIYAPNSGGSPTTTTIWSQNDYAGGRDIQVASLILQSGTSGDGIASYGYVDDSNTYTAVDTFTGTHTGGAVIYTRDWNTSTYSIPSGAKRPAIRIVSGTSDTKIYLVDLVLSTGAKLDSYLTVDNNLTDNYGLRGDPYTFTSEYNSAGDTPILSATCSLGINGTFYAMTYNSSLGKYVYNYSGFVSDGDYTIKHTCSSNSYNDGNESYTVHIATAPSQIITIEPIANISAYSISNFTPNIYLTSSNNTDALIFSVINSSTAYNVNFNWTNTTSTASKQYSVYSSTDGVNWVFDDTANFGAGTAYNDGLQKISISNGYSYSFNTTLPNATKVYYKLVYATLPASWRTIANSADWVNLNQPTIYTDSNGHTWDLFTDSTYTPIKSYTDKQFPLLTSTDLNTGFEIQFTAYADNATTLKVGYQIDGSPYIHIIPITTTKTRYSVPTIPSSREARLVIYSDGNNTNVYVTDYAIVPKSYFTSRLEVFQNDGSPLNAVIIGGVSKVYLREGIGYKIQTSAFDREGDLQRLRIEASISGTAIKSKEFLLSEATSAEKIFTWDELIEGFVDYNGSSTDTRSIYIKATLYNSANKSVAQQSQTVNILQYPYFQDDIVFNIYSVNAKVSENPEIRFNITQKDYSQFVGVKLYVYDSDHNLSNPNYSETILNSKLGCTSFVCSKNLKVDSYVFEEERQYFIGVQLILKTEAPSTTNPLTIKIFSQFVTYRQFETSRIFQVGERADRTYRNDEKIQLVLQLRDVPYKNLSADTDVYLNIDNCDADTAGNCTTGATKFYPKKFIYDETTGYNYYFFDQLFYTDAGGLLPDGNYMRFRATITDSRYSHDTGAIPVATLADKCASDSYGTLFNSDWFNMNFFDRFWDATERALYGCGTLTSPIVAVNDAEETRILIEADHNVIGGQNQSIACLKIDNENFQNTLEQDLVCVVLWTKNQQSIDQFKITIGNEFSDYSKTGNNAQYLSFDIPAEQLIFSDQFMMAQSLQAEYGTDTLETVGELAFYGFDKLFSGIANPLTNILEGTTKSGMITNIGFDVNWTHVLDPTYVKGFFFFKVKGLKVINQYDYINKFPELETINPKFFREFANSKGIVLPINKTLVNVYTNDLTNWSLIGDQLDSLETVSPLVIYSQPSFVQTGFDTNAKQVVTILKFNLVSDMLSNNNTASQRVFLPLIFSYVPPVKMLDFFGIIDELLYGKDSAGNPAGLLTNPVGFFFKNWFWFVLGVIGLLILSLIVRNFRTRGSNITVNNQGRGN